MTRSMRMGCVEKLRILLASLVSILVGCGGTGEPQHEGEAGPAEVVAKVRKAAALLAEQGDAALAVLRDSSSEFMWKDTYVFVVNCDANEVMANPAFPERQGGDIKQHTDYNGMQYGLMLCETAQRPGGGWVEYVWLKPGGDEPRRKISYVMSAEGTPYQLGAGIYNDSITLEELESLTREQP